MAVSVEASASRDSKHVVLGIAMLITLMTVVALLVGPTSGRSDPATPTPARSVGPVATSTTT